ncbi:UDP-N-acetylmuramate dehydrogenase, partial [Alphaproteobacteria bacterium]|nr:UDP-N-acetylmuramate dehydrogenase [Alphaproteobacteria bacterium]
SCLIDNVPKVRGELLSNADIGSSSWFRVGGPAELLYLPADELDLLHFMTNLKSEIPLFVIGASSNILIRDGGIRGVVIKLGSAFKEIKLLKNQLLVGAYSHNMMLAKYANNKNLFGFDFLSGIPGTIGGSIKMNAGCYGTEMSDILIKVKVIDRLKGVKEISAKDLKLKYRESVLSNDSIIISAYLKVDKKTKYDVNIIKNIRDKRLKSQPVGQLTGGSTFKNPPGYKVWQLIDDAGCRGLSVGGAKISDIHTNFIINYNNATAKDIETLGNIVREKVFDNTGIRLDWEILKVGF